LTLMHTLYFLKSISIFKLYNKHQENQQEKC
jgi:hypothetical protein